MDKDKFFAAAAPPSEVIELKGFGPVRVSALSLEARLDFADLNHDDALEVLNWLVCRGVDGLGLEDMEQVRGMDGSLKQDIADVVIRLSGMGDDPEDAKNA